MTGGAPAAEGHEPGRALEVLAVATRLGLTSFGGPIAHLGYFHEEYVTRRRWLDEATYAEIVALCQSLPGPASSQVGIAVGTLRAGLLGGLLAWVGFTLPSAAAMIAFAYGLDALGSVENAGWLHGLKVAAVAVVAYAVWTMARSLAPDRPRATMAILAALIMLAWQTAVSQLLVIVLAGLVGWRLFRDYAVDSRAELRVPIGRGVAIACWALFFGLVIALPVARGIVEIQALAVFDSFYRVGSLVFGGGHVVLPLLQTEVVARGWVSQEDFIAGYGAAQAVPGPLFTFSAYLGAVMEPEPNGVTGGALALTAIFLPSFLLVLGGLPLWGVLRRQPAFQSALRGVNAAVVGILLAALYDPVWTSAIGRVEDFGLALAAFGLLALWRVPPLLVVLFAAAGGAALAA
jgi:chromate transporter